LDEKLISLLQQQKAYWKQRGAIKWVTLGDASTKFFHAQATIKYRRNLITQLVDSNGNILVNHADKANLIWLSFKDRLVTSNFTSVNYDLASFFSANPDSSMLVLPFSRDEIDSVIKAMPPDKALGPDGFNTDFIKHC